MEPIFEGNKLLSILSFALLLKYTVFPKNLCVYGMGQRTFHSLKRTIYQQVLKAGANEASAQQYQKYGI